MQKILVIQTAFIGDAVLATGIVEKLHNYYPAAAIDYMVRKGNEGLLHGHPFIKEVLVWNKKEKKLLHLWQLLKKIRTKKYDAVINVQRYAATGLLTAFSGAKHRIGYDKNPLSFLFTTKIPHRISTAEQPVHETARCNDLIKELTGSVAFKPVLYPTAEAYNKVTALQQQPYITIAPASVWFTKQYPAQQWAAFIRQLPAGIKVFLLGAPSDTQLCNEIISESGRSDAAQNCCGQFSFLESAALMKNALMNYVNDSAPMHFASAVNAPVAAIYCSTLPSFGYGPLSDSRHIIEVQEPLACRPCGGHGRKECPEGHFNCGYKITPHQLLAVLAANG
jgi:heptosyltransferase-2